MGVLVARPARVVVRGHGHGGDRAAVHGHDLTGELVVDRGVPGAVVVRHDCRVVFDRELGLRVFRRAGHRPGEPVAAVGVLLGVVPGREGVVRVHSALAGLVRDLDRPALGRAVLRQLEHDALWGDVVLRVMGVVLVEDAVDPAVRARKGSARRLPVRALVEHGDRGLSPGRRAGDRGDCKNGSCRTDRDQKPLQLPHLAHLSFLPSLLELALTRLHSPSSNRQLGLDFPFCIAMYAPPGASQSLGRVSGPLARET